MPRLNKPKLLNERFGIEIKEQDFAVKCERCGEGIGGYFLIGKRGGAWLIFNGIFHHINRDRKDNSFENIAVVCYRCHCQIHGIKYYPPKPINYEKGKADIHKIAKLLD